MKIFSTFILIPLFCGVALAQNNEDPLVLAQAQMPKGGVIINSQNGENGNIPGVSLDKPQDGANPAGDVPGQRSQTLELPQTFRGCWEGSVPKVDSTENLDYPAPSIWAAKTYHFCYQWGQNLPYELTFGSTGFDSEDPISSDAMNVKSSLKVVTVYGASHVLMRSFLSFTDSQSGGLTEEVTDLDCYMADDSMAVLATMNSKYNGIPWTKDIWHAKFFRKP